MARIKNSSIIIKERRRWLFFGLPFTFKTYTLTDKKLVYKEGFFTTSEDEILLYRILDIGKKRTFMQKIFGLGTLSVTSSDKSMPKLDMINIKHISEYHTFLSENIERERLRVRFRSAEVIETAHDHDQMSDHADDPDFMLGGSGGF